MKKSDLTQIISAPTIAKLSKGQNVQTDVIDKICTFLEVQPSDIMEVIDDEAIFEDTGTKMIFKKNADPIEQHLFGESFMEDGITSYREVIEDEDKYKEFIASLQKQRDEFVKKQK